MPNPLTYYAGISTAYFLNNLPRPVAMALIVELPDESLSFAEELSVDEVDADVEDVTVVVVAADEEAPVAVPAEAGLVIFAPSIIPSYALNSEPNAPTVWVIDVNCCSCTPVVLFERADATLFIKFNNLSALKTIFKSWIS